MEAVAGKSENQERSGRKKWKQQVESWLNEVEHLEKDLGELKQEATRGNKNRDKAVDMKTDVENQERSGRKKRRRQVESWLNKDENVSSISIYGMGGVGKTTLAKHIYNHLREESSYQVHWATVSLGLIIKRLQDDLAKIEKMDLSDVEDEHRRVDQLNWTFKKMKNIVIILDDICECLSLEKLGYPLGVEDCRLILTSRSSEAYQNMGCKELLEVKKLNTNDSWELFRKSLGSETRLSPNIEGVAKTMEGRCKGLPLGLITLEGSMRGVTDLREWKNSLKEFLDDLENDVFKVLKYSYDRLRNTTMQECFLYCDLYPEDYVIDRYELIDRFMIESPVKGNSREEEFHHGHTILNKLVTLCLLEAPDNM
ncbi:hypothetical protein FXO38_34656 [Capsicum annuum]|nr:hypothetical protein FXO38_34656 [Capsicum annuum]KAF3618611.1 hypothetical protein FXO37_34107 [Capsicum annuum]